MPEHFHFLQPLWFLVLIPAALLLWWLPRARRADSHWQRACESHLLPYLLNKPVQAFSQLPAWLFAAGCLLAVTALADPVWQKKMQPVFRSQDAVVVVLDLSRSMLSSDLTPSRLERARFKVADILNRRKEGLTGLVVFAGDAFTVAPLTNDARTIQSLLTPLHPDLMPLQGSRVDLGLREAGKLLLQAGVPQGDILLMTDGYSDPDALDVAADLRRQGYRLSVLGVGSDRPAPIPDGRGGFVRDSQGQVVLPALEPGKLQQLASAGGGNYHTISVSDDDLALALPASVQTLDARGDGTQQASDAWQSQGPWLVLALLPLAALAFRRGWLLTLPLVMLVSLGSLPRPAMASGWDDLWQRPEQQADQALRSKDFARARQLAQQPLRRGEAAYRAGDYAAALNAYSASDTAQGNYNRGNTLAQLGRYQEAIASYDQALAKSPDMADARYNKQALEKLLQQQPPQADKNKSGDSKDQNTPQQADNKNGDSKDKNGKKTPDSQNGGNSKDNDKNSQQQADAGQASDDKDKNDKGKNDRQQTENHKDAASKDQTSKEQSEAKAQSRQPAGAEPPSDKQTEAGQAQQDQKGAKTRSLDTAADEQQQADERWLRRIPDDPGGLLRRKFLYQYSQRVRQQDAPEQAW